MLRSFVARILKRDYKINNKQRIHARITSQQTGGLSNHGSIAEVNHFLYFVNHSIPILGKDAPYFITGNSLGGAIVMYAAEEISNNKYLYPSNFKGVIPIAPAIGVDPRAIPPSPIVSCLSILSYMAPAAQPPLTPFEDPTKYNCPDNTTRNFSGHWPLSTSKMLLDLTSKKVNQDREHGAISLQSVNILLITGEKDMVVPVETIKSFYSNVESTRKKLFLMPNTGHDLLFEDKSSTLIMDEIFHWIDTLK